MFDHFRAAISPSGEMVVPITKEYIIFGPYSPMRSGDYVVYPQIASDDAFDDLGVLEICDNGVVLSSIRLSQGAVLTARLPSIKGLEIRIKANAVPFVFRGILMVHLPAEPATPPEGVGEPASLILEEISSRTKESRFLSEKLNSIMRTNSYFDILIAAMHCGVDANIVNSPINEINFLDHFQTWLAARPPTKVIDVWGSCLAENATSLEALGLDLNATRIASSDLHGLNALYAEQANEPSVRDKLLLNADNVRVNFDDMFSELSAVQGGFSKLAASLGRAYTTCPFTGQTVSTQHCIPIAQDQVKQVFLFYKFDSVVTFYIIVAAFSGSKLFLYVPGSNVALRLHSPSFEWGDVQTPVNEFLKLTLQNSVAVSEYFRGNTRSAALSGTMNNVGHFLWNEVSGVVKYAAAGYLDKVEVGVLYRHAYIDPFKLIDEMLLPRRYVAEDAASLLLVALQERLFFFRPIDYQINAEVAERLRKISNQFADAEQLAQSNEALRCDYLLWVGLRDHNKVWVNQIDGLCAVVDKLSRDYKTVALYVDGTPDCARHLELLSKRIPGNVKVFAGINVTIYDTIMWAFKIDSYITTIGSGLTFVTWVAGKHGVAHSETHHLGQMSFWGGVRPDVPLPLTPCANQIVDLGDSGYCDYEIEPDVIADLFGKLPKPVRG